ncbi:hypothetical protein F4819DRAFT_455249 [Hypoxylon fuscum]|nr:hypothetical protein F4819DRAFT_455249 [Hypoxylon fuscum]
MMPVRFSWLVLFSVFFFTLDRDLSRVWLCNFFATGRTVEVRGPYHIDSVDYSLCVLTPNLESLLRIFPHKARLYWDIISMDAYRQNTRSGFLSSYRLTSIRCKLRNILWYWWEVMDKSEILEMRFRK